MINQIRYKQKSEQVKAFELLNQQQSTATYQNRDPTTGQRNLLAADGSQLVANYLSTSEAQATPFHAPSSALGVPGFITNR